MKKVDIKVYNADDLPVVEADRKTALGIIRDEMQEKLLNKGDSIIVVIKYKS